MHSQRDSCSVCRKGNLHTIHSAFDAYRNLQVCVYITEHDCIMSMHQIPAAWIRTPTVYPYTNYLTCGSPLPSVSSAAHACSTRFLQHGLGLLAHMILTQSQAYIRPPAYPKEEVNLSTLHEEWGVNTAPQEFIITFSPLLSISSAKHSTRFLQHGSGRLQLTHT